MADLCMENYFVLGIRWSPGPGQPLDDVGFAHDEEEQNEAFETLQQLLDMEEREPEENEEDSMTSVAGPKRMELELKQKHTPTVIRKLVVTYAVGPSGSFKSYVCHGRLYKENGQLDRFQTQGMNSDLWNISSIKTYPGGISPPVTAYIGQYNLVRTNDAWEKVATFLEGLQPSELSVIDKWQPAWVDDDEDDIYGYGAAHYTNRVPNHYQHGGGAYSNTYKPPVGLLRTSGDDIGALIHKETCELILEQPVEHQEMDILEYLEKKDEAETEEIPVEISAKIDAAATTGGGGSSDVESDSAIIFCDCNSPSCNTCEEISIAEQFAGCGYTLH